MPRPIFSGQPLGPACGDMLSPFPPLPPLPRGTQSHRQRWTWAFPTQAGGRRALRWSVTPAAKRETTLSQMRSHVRFAVLLKRHTPGPETTDALRARVLMDEGWEELSAVLRGGDKTWALNYPSNRRKPVCSSRGTQELESRRRRR